MNPPTSTTRQHSGVLARQRCPHHSSSDLGGRSFSSDIGPASCSGVITPEANAASPRMPVRMTGTEILDFPLTHTKHATSRFLIDNFHRPSTPAIVSRSSASFASSASCISNRHSPRLETPVSHRKQTIGALSNRHKIAFGNFHHLRVLNAGQGSFPLLPLPLLPPLLPVPPHSPSRLLTFDPQLPFLIANDMHSRKNPCYCKHSTYEILIENEIHCRGTRSRAFSYGSPASCASSASSLASFQVPS